MTFILKPKWSLAVVLISLLILVGGMSSCAPSNGSSTEELSKSESSLLTVDQATEMNKHSERGVSCSSCHGSVSSEEDYQTPTSEACYSCHDQGEIIEATQAYDDTSIPLQNPHDSHVGTPQCSSCHSNHGESTLYCNECHIPEFQLMVP